MAEGSGSFGEPYRYIKAIGEQKIGEQKIGEYTTVSTYAKYIFSVFENIGEENFGEWLTIRQIRQFFPLPKFSLVWYCSVLFLSLSSVSILVHPHA